MKEKEYECTPLLYENLINTTKEWLSKEGFDYQEFSMDTEGIVIQTHKKKSIVNIGFKAPTNNEVCTKNIASTIIESGEIWHDINNLPKYFEIFYPCRQSCSVEKKRHLEEMRINIFKIIDNLKSEKIIL